MKGTVTNHLVTPQFNHDNVVETNKNDLLVPEFSFSAFRKELMRKVIAEMSDYRENVLPVSKIYANARYNKHAFSEIGSTKALHQLIITEHEIKNRIVGSSLKLKIALGYISRNTIADSQDGYFDSELAMDYSS